MCDEQKFYICKHCGNIVGKIQDGGVPMVCCGEEMSELVANTHEGSHEKHIPVIEKSGNNITVMIGSTAHPMTKEHHIAWVYLQTNLGGHRKCLETGSEPKVCFTTCGNEKAVAAFAYCNLHGLWKTNIN